MIGKNIVAIDDEADILEILSYNFTKERANISIFNSGIEGLDYIRRNKPDAIICDWMLPDIDGLQICRTVKTNDNLSDVPFVMLTARSDEIDTVLALEMGADDYLAKPVRVKELITRVRRLIKQNTAIHPAYNPVLSKPEGSQDSSDSHSIYYKVFRIDTEKYKAYMEEEELTLTHSEFKLLHLFVKKPGRVFTRNQIIEKLCGIDYIVTERSIDVQVVGLRKKLGKHKDYLETVRGVGYRFKE